MSSYLEIKGSWVLGLGNILSSRNLEQTYYTPSETPTPSTMYNHTIKLQQVIVRGLGSQLLRVYDGGVECGHDC